MNSRNLVKLNKILSVAWSGKFIHRSVTGRNSQAMATRRAYRKQKYAQATVDGTPLQEFVDNLDDTCRKLLKVLENKDALKDSRRDMEVRYNRARKSKNKLFAEHWKLQIDCNVDVAMVFEKLEEKLLFEAQNCAERLEAQTGIKYDLRDLEITAEEMLRFPVDRRFRHQPIPLNSIPSDLNLDL